MMIRRARFDRALRFFPKSQDRSTATPIILPPVETAMRERPAATEQEGRRIAAPTGASSEGRAP